MVQSLGISVGNANSYVAAGQGGGIEILLNEYSSRSTPSMVAFTDNSRSIGVDASSNLFMNLKNTIYDLILLLGKPYKELNLQDSRHVFKIEEAADGQAIVVVRHLGKEMKFTITQVLAMLLSKLRDVAHGATHCVLSYPQFYDDTQKAALVQAALIAGLHPLDIITDMSAVMLNYAYFRTTKDDQDRYLAFVNFGQSNLQCVVAHLKPNEDLVKVLSTESEQIGGHDFDKILANHFIREHKLDLTPKAHLKLISACEKVKKTLSANANDIPINVESLISEDKDFTARIDRATFEQLSQDLLKQVEACLVRTLDNARKQAEFELHAVEIVGGSSRIPAVKQLIQNTFNLTASTTLNTDEAVARGCVIHCANLHPGMKVKRQVSIVDLPAFSKPALNEEARRTELELITIDKKYMSKIEARNSLEEFIYSERSKSQGNHAELLSTALDWLLSDEGEDAKEEDYVKKLDELRKIIYKEVKKEKKTPPPKEENNKSPAPKKEVAQPAAPQEGTGDSTPKQQQQQPKQDEDVPMPDVNDKNELKNEKVQENNGEKHVETVDETNEMKTC